MPTKKRIRPDKVAKEAAVEEVLKKDKQFNQLHQRIKYQNHICRILLRKLKRLQ